MSSKRTKEEIMKRLVLIVIAVLGLSLVIAGQAQAKSSGIPKTETQATKLRQENAPGMTQAEYRALLLRSEGLNRLYGVGVPVKGENYYARGFSAAPDESVPVKGENYFARGVQSTPQTVASSTSDFEWGDVAIGGAGLLGLVAIAVGLVGFRRHRPHLRTS
jgi:hypothetical protein